MNRGGRAAAAALAAILCAAPAAAQDYRTAVGYGAGAIAFSGLTDSGPLLRFDPGWVVLGQLDQWLGPGRFGLRFTGAFSRPSLQFTTADRTINVWLLSGDLVMRLAAPARDRRFAPFLTVGAGIAHYGFGRGPRIRLVDTEAVYPGHDQLQWAATAGLGADIMTGLELGENPIALRIEAVDHIAIRSPFESTTGERFGPMHNGRVTIAILSMLGYLFGPTPTPPPVAANP